MRAFVFQRQEARAVPFTWKAEILRKTIANGHIRRIASVLVQAVFWCLLISLSVVYSNHTCLLPFLLYLSRVLRTTARLKGGEDVRYGKRYNSGAYYRATIM